MKMKWVTSRVDFDNRGENVLYDLPLWDKVITINMKYRVTKTASPTYTLILKTDLLVIQTA